MTDHVAVNRARWDADAPRWVDAGHRNWTENTLRWGIWHTPESLVHFFPDVDGLDVIELGCGTAYISSYAARRGARVVGLDNSGQQLATARRFQREFGIEFPLIHADAERVPLADESFDFAVSEYGAAIWCDPYSWIPEAARILRPGGRLHLLGNSALLMLTMPDLEADGPAKTELLRPYFGMHRFTWPDDPSIEFHIPHGDWIRLFRWNGFEVEDLVEIQPPEGSTTPHPLATLEWSRRWPCEEVWKVRKR